MSAPPTLGKAFILATINPGDVSRLTITLSNPNTSVALLTAPLTDTLPSGVVIAPLPNASTNCGGRTTVTAVVPPPVSTTLPPPTIPTTGEWGMMLFAAALLGFMAWMIQARRNIK
jgi:uncharacterized repeat protein (TIGR01451 family)